MSQIDVEVIALRNHFGEQVKVTEATLVYVAIDEDGKPRPVIQA